MCIYTYVTATLYIMGFWRAVVVVLVLGLGWMGGPCCVKTLSFFFWFPIG